MKNLFALSLVLLASFFTFSACTEEERDELLPIFMECKIGNAAWTMQGVRPTANERGSDPSKVITVIGTSTNQLIAGSSSQLSFTLFNFDGPRTYEVKPDTLSSKVSLAVYLPSINSPDSLFNTASALSFADSTQSLGQVVVDSYDEATGVMKGTFLFTVRNQSTGESLQITEGRFEAK